jgi:hypothetical protein
MNTTDVIKQCNPKKEFISIEKGNINLVMVFDHDALVKKNEKKIVRVYRLHEDGETVTPIDIEGVIIKLIQSVKKNVNIEELLTEVFRNTPPDLLIQIDGQLTDQLKIEASSEPQYHCCYSIIFGDKTKPGHIEIPISGGRYDKSGQNS